MSNKMNLSPEMEARIMALRLETQSPTDVLEQVVSLGCYQLEYRRKANPKKAAEQKLAREVLKRAQRDPELAERLGLGKRVTL